MKETKTSLNGLKKAERDFVLLRQSKESKMSPLHYFLRCVWSRDKR